MRGGRRSGDIIFVLGRLYLINSCKKRETREDSKEA